MNRGKITETIEWAGNYGKDFVMFYFNIGFNVTKIAIQFCFFALGHIGNLLCIIHSYIPIFKYFFKFVRYCFFSSVDGILYIADYFSFLSPYYSTIKSGISIIIYCINFALDNYFPFVKYWYFFFSIKISTDSLYGAGFLLITFTLSCLILYIAEDYSEKLYTVLGIIFIIVWAPFFFKLAGFIIARRVGLPHTFNFRNYICYLYYFEELYPIFEWIFLFYEKKSGGPRIPGYFYTFEEEKLEVETVLIPGINDSRRLIIAPIEYQLIEDKKKLEWYNNMHAKDDRNEVIRKQERKIFIIEDELKRQKVFVQNIEDFAHKFLREKKAVHPKYIGGAENKIFRQFINGDRVVKRCSITKFTPPAKPSFGSRFG